MYGLYGLIHGVYVGNLIRIGSELAGISDTALFAGFQAFFSGLGGMIGPPVTSMFSILLQLGGMIGPPVTSMFSMLLKTFLSSKICMANLNK